MGHAPTRISTRMPVLTQANLTSCAGANVEKQRLQTVAEHGSERSLSRYVRRPPPRAVPQNPKGAPPTRPPTVFEYAASGTEMAFAACRAGPCSRKVWHPYEIAMRCPVLR
eukprot:1446825-Rhodomonas_salina.4